MMTAQRQIFEQGAQPQNIIPLITIGTVVDTNDPQEMGRMRIVCPQWGDTWGSNVEALPWALYMSPMAGQVQVGTRGPGIQQSEGGIAYGLWAIPKVGAQAVVVCVDGNPMTRMCIGCIYDQFVPHTMPHGRYMYDDHPALEKDDTNPLPAGPYTSTEQFIHPLRENQKRAFGNVGEPNYEYRTRAADYSVSSVNVSQLGQTYSQVADDKGHVHDGWTSTQGYQSSRSDPHAPSSLTDKSYDSMVVALTTPGFHALSMDDRQENCRVRLRTTSGHQIIMDDTNERIYISTALGNNWVEMDQDGNIDVYSNTRISVHAAKDINITSDETVRLYGKKGVHIKSDAEIRMHSGADMHIKSDANIRQHANTSIYHQAGSQLHLRSDSSLFIQSTGGSVNVQASGQFAADASSVHLNSGNSSSSTTAGEQKAMWTNRVPQHEPYARTLTANDFTHAPEFPYDSPQVNRQERGRNIDRGTYWRR